MKRYVLLGATLAMVAGAGVALAQAPSPPPPPGADGPPPRPGMERWGRHMGPGPGMRAMMQASKAARFHLARGENVVDIRCAADEPMKACVDAASQLLDKLASQPR